MSIFRPGQKVYDLSGMIEFKMQLAIAETVPWYLLASSTPVIAYQWKGAASYAAAKVNLANPGTYDAYAGVDPAWAAGTGITANGSAWLETGLSLTQVQAQAGSLICCMSFPAAIIGIIWGAFHSPPACWALEAYQLANIFRYRWPRANYDHSPYATGVHVMALVANKVYFDGAYITAMGNQSLMSSVPLRIFTNYLANNILSAGNLYANAYWNALLSDDEVAAVSTAMAAL